MRLDKFPIMKIEDNADMRHFELRTDDNKLAVIEYQIQERKYFLTKTTFPEGFEESGEADKMVKEVLKMIEETGMRVVPMTRFIKQYFKRHRDMKYLLPVGIHL